MSSLKIYITKNMILFVINLLLIISTMVLIVINSKDSPLFVVSSFLIQGFILCLLFSMTLKEIEKIKDSVIRNWEKDLNDIPNK